MDDDVHALAAEQGLNLEALHAALAALRMHAGGDIFYVFWLPRGRVGSDNGKKRSRTLLAFPSPDAALGFAQRNRLVHPPDVPRLRLLSLAQLLRAILREPSIVALHLVFDTEDLQSYPPGHLPPGLHLTRADVVRLIGAQP
ncbi:hypothetical protein [Roseiflexus castenholzii]|jgi:hypothetical protein|uniref:SseB protein N-terminal domain-containing protein n=1 Tax=Roseiflexus castenholzii (strain DSM 13941 / HLO8) TaxID=383372 RepID=A7NFC1_ROSCS|nr:hypothetical protein [Roseiflexus castenholzii]ABU56143.1 conserved hypothetical protein [Roseiflexus castenholzii DSM 13941]